MGSPIAHFGITAKAAERPHDFCGEIFGQSSDRFDPALSEPVTVVSRRPAEMVGPGFDGYGPVGRS